MFSCFCNKLNYKWRIWSQRRSWKVLPYSWPKLQREVITGFSLICFIGLFYRSHKCNVRCQCQYCQSFSSLVWHKTDSKILQIRGKSLAIDFLSFPKVEEICSDVGCEKSTLLLLLTGLFHVRKAWFDYVRILNKRKIEFGIGKKFKIKSFKCQRSFKRR